MNGDSGKAERPVFSRPFKVEDVRDKAIDLDVAAEPAECAALAAEIGVPAIHALSARNRLILWEPRIDLLDVQVTPDPTDRATLLIRIDYRVRATNTRFNLVYPFYLDGSPS